MQTEQKEIALRDVRQWGEHSPATICNQLKWLNGHCYAYEGHEFNCKISMDGDSIYEFSYGCEPSTIGRSFRLLVLMCAENGTHDSDTDNEFQTLFCVLVTVYYKM